MSYRFLLVWLFIQALTLTLVQPNCHCSYRWVIAFHSCMLNLLLIYRGRLAPMLVQRISVNKRLSKVLWLLCKQSNVTPHAYSSEVCRTEATLWNLNFHHKSRPNGRIFCVNCKWFGQKWRALLSVYYNRIFVEECSMYTCALYYDQGWKGFLRNCADAEIELMTSYRCLSTWDLHTYRGRWHSMATHILCGTCRAVFIGKVQLSYYHVDRTWAAILISGRHNGMIVIYTSDTLATRQTEINKQFSS